jgi:hypothetical protein
MGLFNNKEKEKKYTVNVTSNFYGNSDFEYYDLTLEQAKKKMKECKDKMMIGLIEELDEGMELYNWKNVVNVNIK